MNNRRQRQSSPRSSRACASGLALLKLPCTCKRSPEAATGTLQVQQHTVCANYSKTAVSCLLLVVWDANIQTYIWHCKISHIGVKFQCFVDLSQHDICLLCSSQSSLQTRGVCILCSFVQHPSKGASAAVSLLSWDPTTTSLYLAILLQPVQPPLPLLCKPELQHWRGTMLSPMQQPSTADAPAHAAHQPAESTGVAPCGISSVSQAWHPTGILTNSSCCALCAMCGPLICLVVTCCLMNNLCQLLKVCLQ